MTMAIIIVNVTTAIDDEITFGILRRRFRKLTNGDNKIAKSKAKNIGMNIYKCLVVISKHV